MEKVERHRLYQEISGAYGSLPIASVRSPKTLGCLMLSVGALQRGCILLFVLKLLERSWVVCQFLLDNPRKIWKQIWKIHENTEKYGKTKKYRWKDLERAPSSCSTKAHLTNALMFSDRLASAWTPLPRQKKADSQTNILRPLVSCCRLAC